MRIMNRRRFLFFCGTVVSAVVALVVILTASMLWKTRIQKSGDVTIHTGESANSIWASFVREQFTNNTLPWRLYAWRYNTADRLQAGTYHLEQGEHVREVIERLVRGEGTQRDIAITYPEGFTLEQIAVRTAKQNIGTMEQFMAAAKPALYAAEFPFLAALPPERTLEGYLFPDTYRVFADDKPHDVIRRMLANFSNKFNSDLRAVVSQSGEGRTVDQVIIMASIVEREVQKSEDMAVIAGILWKRHDVGMGLDADATIRYARDKWDEPLTIDDLAVDSPYNTRRYRGLPPGPISNPGLAAIVTAIHPEESEYWYYLSASDGTTIYAKTNEEHNLNKAKYL